MLRAMRRALGKVEKPIVTTKGERLVPPVACGVKVGRDLEREIGAELWGACARREGERVEVS